MKQIPLTRGLYALVDDADYERLSVWKWHANKSAYDRTFYAVRWHGKTKIRMHHEIVGKPSKPFEVDHRNHNGLDNQRHNLVVCTLKRWQAYYYVNGRQVCVGHYDTAEQARDARARSLDAATQDQHANDSGTND